MDYFKKGKLPLIVLLSFIYLAGCNDGVTTGKLEISSFQTYEGEIKKGKPHGQGKMYTVTVDDEPYLLYEGAFEDGSFEGFGTRFYPDGTTQYEGEWHEFVYHGNGKLYKEDGTLIYEGDFKYGFEFVGEGNIYDDSGDLLYSGPFPEGQWLKGERNLSLQLRPGIIDRIYEGEWQNNEPHGLGKEYYRSGQLKYDGNFKNGKWHGKGTHYGQDGTVLYEGLWEENEMKK